MNLKVEVNKTRYNKGQIFPFLIAIVVVVIIIAMITVNLGQIGVFRTDVSNAADAAALAGASTLSGYLLGFGLKSDLMCGEMIVEIVVIILACCSVIGIPVAIASYIAYIVKMLVTYMQSLEDGKMAWSNAKKSALQYAFQNAGVDEPRPTFKQFIKEVYGESDPEALSAERLACYSKIYALGDDPDACAPTSDAIKNNIKKFSQTGFSRFMEDSINGIWKKDEWGGEIKPGNMSPAIVVNGYGWNVDEHGAVTNSYDSGDDYKRAKYDYVEVEVTANVIYPLSLYNPVRDIIDSIEQYIRDSINLPEELWWLEWCLEGLITLIIEVVVGGLIWTLLPGGLEMDPIEANTDNNPITVTVRKFKKSNDLGLWTFRYGTVQATASAHAFGEVDPDGIKRDIKPLFFTTFPLWTLIQQALAGQTPTFEWFDTTKHLFETELMYAG